MASDWERCSQWLLRCQVVCEEQVDSVHSLAAVLRDGVVPCRLINQLRPNTIAMKDFSQRPQLSQFLYLKNVRVFLQSCKKVFGVKDADLFDPYDLIEAKDFNKVIHTLSVLSRTREALKTVHESFCEQHEEIYSINEIYDDEVERIYKNIDDDFDDDYEEVYGSLVEYTKRDHLAVPVSKREMCRKELLDTEKNYIDVLRLITDKFQKPLQKRFPSGDFNGIFLHIEELWNIHSRLYDELQRSSDMNHIANCFVNVKCQFVIYGDFCCNLTDAQASVEKIRNSESELGAFIAQLNVAANDNKFKLSEMLTVPLQRVLKYHLLLKELIKHTDDSHPDTAPLSRALEEMQDLSFYVNEVKRDTEHLDLIQQIEQSITDLQKYLPSDTHLREYGRHLYDGKLKMTTGKSTKFSDRYIFLFEKLLLACKSKGDSYSYRDFVIIAHYELLADEIQPPGSAHEKYTFSLKERRPDSESDLPTVYTFAVKDADSLIKWTQHISLAIETVQPVTDGETYRLVTFPEPTSCTVCKKLLRGVIFQGYRSRQDGTKQVHKECLSKSVAASDIHPTKQKPMVSRPAPIAASNVSVSHQVAPRHAVRTCQASDQQHKQLSNCPWYHGPVSRSDAKYLLEACDDGTFLVRTSNDPGAETKFVLSIKCSASQCPVKHIRIEKSVEGQYSLVSGTAFPDIIALVDHYRQNSLQPHFRTVRTALLTPCPKTVRQHGAESDVIGYCVTLYNFAARNTQELSFNADETIAIISRARDMWWRGRLNGMVGLFPCNYVKELP